MNSIESYIYVKNHLPHELCEELIYECNKFGTWKQHNWNNNIKGITESRYDKELFVMNSTDKQQSRVNPYIANALKDYMKIHEISGDETKGIWLHKISPIRFNKYPVGTMMRKHFDHIHSIFDGENKGVPLVSVVANLNDDYQGSEFYLRDKKIDLKKGDLLLFPSNFMFPHEVTKTIKGVRYSFVAWAF